MCGRINQRSNLAVVTKLFQIETTELEQLPIRYNIAPDQNRANVPVVRLADGKRQLALLRWGLIPSWSKEPKTKFSTIVARAETIATKPTFRTAYQRRRCLVLADGYYEWRAEGKIKQPYLYEVDGGGPFAMAGVWEAWRSGEGPPLETCAIITTAANTLAQEVNDRMPVILEAGDYAAWLDPAADDLAYLLAPFPAERMAARAVSTYVNNARNEGPECLTPA